MNNTDLDDESTEIEGIECQVKEELDSSDDLDCLANSGKSVLRIVEESDDDNPTAYTGDSNNTGNESSPTPTVTSDDSDQSDASVAKSGVRRNVSRKTQQGDTSAIGRRPVSDKGWCFASTHLLIDRLRQRVRRLGGADMQQHKQVFKEITRELNEGGFDKTFKETCQKWQSMVLTYRKLKNFTQKDRIKWKFYKVFDVLMPLVENVVSRPFNSQPTTRNYRRNSKGRHSSTVSTASVVGTKTVQRSLKPSKFASGSASPNPGYKPGPQARAVQSQQHDRGADMAQGQLHHANSAESSPSASGSAAIIERLIADQRRKMQFDMEFKQKIQERQERIEKREMEREMREKLREQRELTKEVREKKVLAKVEQICRVLERFNSNGLDFD